MDLTQFHGGAAGGEAVPAWKHSHAPGFLHIPKVLSCHSRGRSVIPNGTWTGSRKTSVIPKGTVFSLFPPLHPKVPSCAGTGRRSRRMISISKGTRTGSRRMFPKGIVFPFSFSSSQGSTLSWDREREEVPSSQGNGFSLFLSLYPMVPFWPGTGGRRMFLIPKGTALPSLPLGVPARTSDSCRVPELSLLQAGRLPGRIPGS